MFAVHSQALPIDFEAGVATASLVNFAGGTASVVANPKMTIVNPSATVGKLVLQGRP